MSFAECIFAALSDTPERASRLDNIAALLFGWRITRGRKAAIARALNQLEREGKAKWTVRVVGGVPCVYWWRVPGKEPQGG